MNLRASAIQYPVGQGELYRCRVECPAHSEPIDFIYDCGSLSKEVFLQASIDRLKMEVGEKELEFLVLSHFDADHVNGLDYLLDGSIPVRTIFLPYLTPLQRLTVAARNPDAADSYYEFLADPAAFLGDRGVDRIVFVVGGEGPPDEELPFDEGPPPDDFRDDTFLKFPTGPDLLQIADEESKSLQNAETLFHKRKVRVGYCWQLKFFNYDSFPDGYRGIRDRAAATPNEGDSNQLQRWKKFVIAVLDATGLPSLEPSVILELLQDPPARARLKDSYKVLKTDHNNVSLALWHGPSFRGEKMAKCSWGDRCRDIHIHGAYHGWWSTNGGTLLTGDLSLKHNFEQFRDHYLGFLSETAFFQLPHHGSAHSWEPRILDEIGDRAVCFTSAGFSNKYGHPHLDVIEDVIPGHPWAGGHERCEIHFRIGYPL